MNLNETNVKNSIKRILDGLNCYHIPYIPGSMGVSGVPDILCCCDGRFLAIEVKYGKGKTRPLQDYHINLINKAGGYAFVVRDSNLSDFKTMMINRDYNNLRNLI